MEYGIRIPEYSGIQNTDGIRNMEYRFCIAEYEYGIQNTDAEYGFPMPYLIFWNTEYGKTEYGSYCVFRNMEFGIRNTDSVFRNREYRIRNTEYGIRIPYSRIRNPEHGIRNAVGIRIIPITECGIGNTDSAIRNPESRMWDTDLFPIPYSVFRNTDSVNT